MGSKQWIGIVLILILISGGVWFVMASNAKNKPAASPTSMAPMHTASITPSVSASSSAAQSSNAVTISNFAFSPADISVKKGTTVTWSNKDTVGHTVTETDSLKGPASGVLNNGDAYSFTFNAAGTYHYHCSIHHEMIGTVTVTD